MQDQRGNPSTKEKKSNTTSNLTNTQSVCLGVITSAHGLRGQVKLKSFTDSPNDIAAYGKVYITSNLSDDGFKITKLKDNHKGELIATLDGISDRTTAESLRGKELYISRNSLPDTDGDDEFYYHDLVGCDVFLDNDTMTHYGTVKALFNFGTDEDLIELESNGDELKSVIISFTKENIPSVNITERKIIVNAKTISETERMEKSAVRKKANKENKSI